MKNILCYKKEDLLALLPEFQLLLIRTLHESEDEFCERQEYHITNRPEIKEIYHYHSLGTSTSVSYKDKAAEHLYSKSVNPERNWLRLTENNFLSPMVNVNAEYIEATNGLIAWLKFNGVTEEALEKITISYALYEVIEYPGVPTPIKHRDGWGYSSEHLVLNGQEIETALNSIEDELLRKKIKCILYARVFKKHY